MTSPSRVDNLCRLTVLTDSSSADVALPVNVPLVEILPGLVNRLGDPRISVAGVVVQRWGEEPLDENRTPSALGLLDGEMLFLRPRQEAIPPAEFDDLVDAITSTTGLPAQRWRAANTVVLMRAGAAVPLALVAAALLLPGPSLARQITALAAALLVAAFAVAADKGFGDRPASLILTAAALVYAGLGGALVQAGEAATGALFLDWLVTPDSAFAGGAAVLVLAVVLLSLLSDMLPLLVPAALVGFLVGLLGLLAIFTSVGTAGGAALVLVLSLIFTVAAPMAAFRLARLQFPPLPDEIEDLDVGIDPLPGREVVAQIRLADRCVTGLLYGLSATSVLAATIVVGVPGWAAGVLVALAAALQLVRTRLLRGVVQRLAVLVSGVYLASLALLRYLGELPPVLAAGLAAGAFLLVALTMLASAVWISDRILPPYWGRAAEIVEWLTCAALLPVSAVLLGVYAWARGFGG